MHNLTVSTLRSICLSIKDSSAIHLQDVTVDEFALLKKKCIWIASERAHARQIIEKLVYGTLDIMGLSRFEVPVQYVACIISMFVDNSNYMTASYIFAGSQLHDISAMAESSQPVDSLESICVPQLFSLILLATANSNDYRTAMNQALSLLDVAPLD